MSPRLIPLLAALALAPTTASAYRISARCDGDASRWDRALIDMRLHPRWGDPATDWGQAFARTMRAWNEVAGASPVFTARRVDRLDHTQHGNDRNEAVPVASATIDGVLGVTHVRRALCPGWTLPWPRTGEIIEADVMINAQHPTLYPLPVPVCDEYRGRGHGASASPLADDWIITREATLIHEFGHALGLAHEDDAMAIMMSTNGEGRYCGSPQFAPHPDDIAGMQSLYPEHRIEHDLAASSLQWDGENRIGMTMARRTVRGCSGELVAMRWSVANRGTEPVDYAVWWHASQSPAINRDDDVLLKVERDRRIEPGQFETHETTLRLSRHLPPGVVHYVGFQLVPAVEHEIHRDNNLSYTATRIALRRAEECR